MLLSGGALCAAGPAPAKPEIDFLYGDHEIFPSALVCFTADATQAPSDETQLGDPRGVLAVRLSAASDHVPVRVTFAATPFFEQSSVVAELERAGQTYHVAPTLRWNNEKLAALKQPIANLVIRATVEMENRTTECEAKVVVHAVNDWLQWYRPREEIEAPDALPIKEIPWDRRTKYTIAAYVNENNPWIDQRITRHALDTHKLEAFGGYQNGPGTVRAEVRAIYETLAELGFKYVNFPQPSAEPVGAERGLARVSIQGVRLVGDALESSQANSIETAAVLASVYRKLELDCVIFIVPGVPARVLLGVYLKPNRADLLAIDVRKLGYASFDAAVEAGNRVVRDPANAPRLLFPGDAESQDRIDAENDGYLTVDIGYARDNGILPIPEFRRDFSAAPPASAAPSTSTLVIMDTQKNVIGYGLLSAALPRPFLAQWFDGTQHGGPFSGNNRIYVIGGLIVLVVIVFLVVKRRKK